MTAIPTLMIRPQRGSDTGALERLAQLDDSTIPDGPLLIAQVDGEPWAALSMTSGDAVADPFHPSGPLTELLRLHAATLDARPPTASRSRLGRLRELLADPSSRGQNRPVSAIGRCCPA